MWLWSNSEAGVYAGTTTLGICLALPNRVKMHIPFKPAIPLLNIYLRETLVRYMSVDSTLSILAKNWTPKCSLTVEWANKLGHHPTTEVHSATKTNALQ